MQVNEFLARLVEPVDADRSTSASSMRSDRVLAQDLVSPISVPPHDNSAMDGFAFDGAQLNAQAPLALRVVGTALAGKAWQGAVGSGQCVKIMTGAIMPAGLDTVVPQEFTRAAGDDRIAIPPKLLQPGDNRRLKGEDLLRRPAGAAPRRTADARRLRPGGQPGHRRRCRWCGACAWPTSPPATKS